MAINETNGVRGKGPKPPPARWIGIGLALMLLAIFAGWHFRPIQIPSLILVVAGTMTAAGYAIRQQEKKKLYRTLFRSEANRRKEAERYRVMVRSSNDAVISTDARGNVEMMNPAAEALTGWSEKESREKPLEEIFRVVDEDTGQAVVSPVPGILREGAAVGPATHAVLVARDGTRRFISESGAPVRDDSGAFIGVVLVFRDQTAERTAINALKDSERKYRRLYETMTDAVVSVSLAGRIQECNPAYQSMMGYSAEALRGLTYQDLTPVKWHALETDIVEKQVMVRGFSDAYEKEYRRKDGSVFPVELRAFLIRDETNTPVGMWAIVRDVTKRKRIETALRENEAYIKTILDKLPVGIAVNSFHPEVRFTYMNDNFARYYRTTREDLTESGRFWEAVYKDPVFREEIKRKVIEDCASGDPQRMRWTDIPIAREGEETTYIEAMNVPIPGNDIMVSVVWDITERKRFEAALMEKTDLLQRITNNMFDMVSITDIQGNIFFLNAAHKLLGYDLASLIGTNIITLVHPDDRQRIATAFMEGLRYVNNRHTIEYRCRCADGGSVWLETVGDILKNPDGSIKELLFSTRDITARKKSELEKEKLQSQLLQAQKMESVGRLAGGVAHDFNNMLNVILGHAELALEGTGPADPLREHLTEIFDAGRRSADITRQLLAFARRQIIAPRVIPVNDTVEKVLKMLRRLIGEDIDLAWKPGPGLWPVNMDPAQIDQILANLLVNARDAIDGVGKITIETGNVSLDETCHAHRGVFAPGDYVLLAVGDNGRGMDEQTLGNLFEPFFTTKKVGEGTGLGLATVYGIVRQNNGFINVYSEPGRGAIFKIYLPRHLGPAEAMEEQGPSGIPTGRGEIVLVVEDEAAVLRLTRKVLERLGYAVLAAPTPEEALTLAGEHAGKIDLLMTDVVMPEMNGRDLAAKLKALYPGLRVLFMSGYTANVIAHHGILDEGVHFIQKPFNKNDLAVKVREALGK